MYDTPYFARIDFAADGEEDAETFIIRRFGFIYANEKLIFDWRAPIFGMFYDFSLGGAGFEAPSGWIEGELTQKRQFMLQNGVMEYAGTDFSAKDYTYQGYVVQAEWIHERFNAYQLSSVKKRLASVAGDVREQLRSLMGMWGEVPDKKINKKWKRQTVYHSVVKYLDMLTAVHYNKCERSFTE